jgi:hypothetical protein
VGLSRVQRQAHAATLRDALDHVPKSGIFTDRHEKPWRATLRDEGLAALAALLADADTAHSQWEAWEASRNRNYETARLAVAERDVLRAALERIEALDDVTVDLAEARSVSIARAALAASPADTRAEEVSEPGSGSTSQRTGDAVDARRSGIEATPERLPGSLTSLPDADTRAAVCVHCGKAVWWSLPRPDDPCYECGKPVGGPADTREAREPSEDEPTAQSEMARRSELPEPTIYADDSERVAALSRDLAAAETREQNAWEKFDGACARRKRRGRKS